MERRRAWRGLRQLRRHANSDGTETVSFRLITTDTGRFVRLRTWLGTVAAFQRTRFLFPVSCQARSVHSHRFPSGI